MITPDPSDSGHVFESTKIRLLWTLEANFASDPISSQEPLLLLNPNSRKVFVHVMELIDKRYFNIN